MRSPRDHAIAAETNPSLLPGTTERVSGYGVMGLLFASGHVLGPRRWTASTVGQPFTSIWHRSPEGRWRFLESAPPSVSCSRWFGAGTCGSVRSTITIDWDSPDDLHIRTADGSIDWRLRLETSPMTRLMNAAGRAMPVRAWTSPRVLGAMGGLASRSLGVGHVGLRGLTANGQDFLANPVRIWRVADAKALIDGYDAASPAPLPEQTRLGDFWIPQRGIFAMGRVSVAPRASATAC